MKVTFLGTGTSQGIPIIGSRHPVCLSTDHRDKRLRASVLVQWDNFDYVIDCGPDFRQQMLRINPEKLDGILFTHEHADHTAGLDDIRPFVFKQGDMPIYAHKRVLNELHKRFDYIFTTENRYPSAPRVKPIPIKNEPFTLGDITVMPVNGWHNNLQTFGFKFNDFVYLTDIKRMDNIEIEKIKGIKVLVVNALRINTHESHFNLEEALAFINIIKPGKAYLTHISHLLGFHKEVEKTLPENVFLAYDNLQISIT